MQEVITLSNSIMNQVYATNGAGTAFIFTATGNHLTYEAIRDSEKEQGFTHRPHSSWIKALFSKIKRGEMKAQLLSYNSV